MKRVTYHSKLYLGESIGYGNLAKIKSDLKKKPATTDVFLITRALNPSDQLDIFNSRYLPQKFYDKHPLYVFGLTKTKEEAFCIIEQITQESLEKRGDANILAYLIGE